MKELQNIIKWGNENKGAETTILGYINWDYYRLFFKTFVGKRCFLKGLFLSDLQIIKKSNSSYTTFVSHD